MQAEQSNGVDALLSIEETVTALSISKSKFHLLVAEGRIATLKLGRKTLVRSSEVSRFISTLAGGGRRSSRSQAA